MKKLLLLVIALGLFSCNSGEKEVTPQETETPKGPKNIILLVGDGMGLSEVSASLFFKESASNFERFPTVGLIKTSAADKLITDSAAGATAFASGIKTYNGAVGVDTDSMDVKTIVEHVSERDIATGVISTSAITHATPAAFYAHSKSRRDEETIASYLPKSGIDFFAGGGLKFFNKRKDSIDMIAELETKGFAMDTVALSKKTDGKQGFLLAQGGMPTMETRGDFLPQAAQLAIEHLSENDNGFFLMIEGSQIDWGGHDNDADYLIGELLDFDTTIGKVLDFAEANGETLVIVTADHETGGFTLSPKEGNYNEIAPSFSTTGHSATMVPVFAMGPGSENFGGIYENTEIYHKMMAVFGK
ncbi:alkaline phosphatase [Aureisphaera galaxeae]|uniref:alkaline phosphatase n=1 Tax=Aureisphaera galaxeae TaxID=1538023 RepID=UPI002350DAE8|nr:alkaline phosphatase [Aureisphaera galaxeae]MDC8005631.1 alkaline phosphatase [Aureisphaera galaxeae]